MRIIYQQDQWQGISLKTVRNDDNDIVVGANFYSEFYEQLDTQGTLEDDRVEHWEGQREWPGLFTMSFRTCLWCVLGIQRRRCHARLRTWNLCRLGIEPIVTARVARRLVSRH